MELARLPDSGRLDVQKLGGMWKSLTQTQRDVSTHLCRLLAIAKAITSCNSVSGLGRFQESCGRVVNQHHSLPVQTCQGCLIRYLLSLKYFRVTLRMQYTNY